MWLRLLLNIAFVITAFLSLAYSVSHYSDGGCDGGLCGLALIFQALPLLISWLFLIVALNFFLGKNRWFYLFITLSVIPNAAILILLASEPNSVLSGPSFLALFIQFMLFIMFYQFRKNEPA